MPVKCLMEKGSAASPFPETVGSHIRTTTAYCFVHAECTKPLLHVQYNALVI